MRFFCEETQEMNDFLSRFKWVLIGAGCLILVAIAVTVGVLVGIGGDRGEGEEIVNAADVPGPEVNEGDGGGGQSVESEDGDKPVARVGTQNFEGKGSKKETFKAGAGLTIVRLTHSGAANFVVQFGQGDGQQLLVNEIGKFAGSKALGLTAGTYTLDISTVGRWSVQIDQTVPGSAESPPQKLQGKGQVATNFFSLKDGEATFRLNHTGSGLFAPNLIKSDGTPVTLLANELGKFNGSKKVEVSKGIYLVDVMSKGEWTIDVQQ